MASKQKITTFLWFDDNAEDIAALQRAHRRAL
jgi:predicted 3-demethylubiquinone-9 3-methyltransferase (glyoxalase superfamily)